MVIRQNNGQFLPPDRSLLKQSIIALGDKWNLNLPRDFELIGPLNARPFSRIYRMDLPLSDPIAVKLCLHSRTLGPNPDLANRQFQILTRCYGRMQANAAFQVPKPLAVFADEGIILMNWVAGNTLRELLRQASVSALPKLMTRAGAWLRHFHDAGPVRVVALDAAELRAGIDKVRENLARQKIKFRGLGEALSVLETHVPILSGLPAESSWAHEDYQPGNIIFTSDAVFGIDISPAEERVTLVDAAYFMNNVQRFTLLPRGLRLVRVRRNLAAAFLRGYAKENAAINRVALSWFRILDDLRFTARHYRNTRTAFHRFYLLQVQRHNLALWVRQLRSSAT